MTFHFRLQRPPPTNESMGPAHLPALPACVTACLASKGNQDTSEVRALARAFQSSSSSFIITIIVISRGSLSSKGNQGPSEVRALARTKTKVHCLRQGIKTQVRSAHLREPSNHHHRHHHHHHRHHHNSKTKVLQVGVEDAVISLAFWHSAN